MPKSIAIIMDGNRRWARAKSLPSFEGHKAGAETLKKISKFVFGQDIKQFAVYAFSLENFKRDKKEVEHIMQLLDLYLKNAKEELLDKDVKLKVIGDMTKLSSSLRKTIEEAESINPYAKHSLFLAIAYGGKQDILQAAQRAKTYKQMDEDLFKSFLWSRDLIEPDILIRTGGEKRLSNFLLWDLAYTELFFTDTYWPDFTEQELKDIIDEYLARQRRFGK